MRKVKGNAAMQQKNETASNQPDNTANPAADAVRLIKKYPNRRLYDTRTSSYITLADVKELVLKNEQFQVVDAKTSEDLTRSILLQIILEEEAGGMPMFTSDLLSQLIRFYGNAMQGMVGNYLEKNMQTFVQVQKQLQEQSRTMYGDNSKINKDLWAQFMNFQGSAMQGMMSAYMDQSKNVFMQMQEQLQNQTKNIFTGFPFPGFPGQPAPPKKDEGDKS
jgi:polyhydroxyalkanoate synthesis repressor PhaR